MNNLFIIFTIFLLACSPRYDRKLYKHWIDKDRDCQNTRTELLINRSLSLVKFKRISGYYKKATANLGKGKVKFKNGKPVKKPCNITFGKWFDPYSGRYFTKSSDLHIDHIIPLKHAHIYGAAKWNSIKKREFANDEENLLIVSAKLNMQKRAMAPHQWMPENKAYWCEYLMKWKYLKRKYRLQFTKSEGFYLVQSLENFCKSSNSSSSKKLLGYKWY